MFRIADADIAEALIWQIWQDYVPRSKRLKLTDGRTVRVYHPGIMNTDSGPDFLGAELSYGPGTRLKGDVEIHIRPSDWRRHGHEKDPCYDTVVLHVVMWNEENLSSIRKQNRQYIPTLVLSEYLQESLNRIKNRYLHKQRPGKKMDYPCRSILHGADLQEIQDRLYEAGHARFKAKSEGISRRMIRVSPEQTLYENLMRTAGYAKNTESFHELARCLPIEWIRICIDREKDDQRTMAIQAVLIGAAGLLPSQRLTASSTIGDHPYVQELEARWGTYGPELSIRSMDEKDWLFFRLRPFNFPTVRLAGMSYLISAGLDHGLDVPFVEIMENSRSPQRLIQQITGKLKQYVVPSAEDYWLTHAVFGAEMHIGRSSLIGLSRHKEMIINAILPFLYALAKQSEQQDQMKLVRQAYKQYPRLSDNRTIRQMSRFLFPKKPDRFKFIDKAILQQALIQIDHATCRNKDCSRCVLGRK